MFRAALLSLVLISAAGCCCPSAATIKHIDTEAAAHDGAARLVEQTLAGQLTGAAAVDNVTPAQLQQTPDTVRRLLRRVISLQYKSRLSWHTLRFTMGDGPDPATLNLSEAPSLGAD